VVFAWAWLTPRVFDAYQNAAMCAFLCVATFFIAVITHNTIHHPVFYSKRLNRIFSAVLSWGFGAAASGFLPGHNLSHHRYLGTPKDNIRPYKMRFRWNLLNQTLFFFVMIPSIVRTESKYVKDVSKVGVARDWWSQHRIESTLLFIGKVTLLWIDWKKALLFVFIPNMYGVWAIFGVNYWQHDGCDENDRYNHSRSFTGGLLNFFACNNGYHAVHHERPGMHWSLLPEYHREHYHGRCHPELEQENLFLYLWRTCIYPGIRINFDGTPLTYLRPVDQDEDWVADACARTAAQAGYDAESSNPAEDGEWLKIASES